MNTINHANQFRYASPYDIPAYVPPPPHPHYAAPVPATYPSPAPKVPCPSNLLISCAPSVATVPCQPSPHPGTEEFHVASK